MPSLKSTNRAKGNLLVSVATIATYSSHMTSNEYSIQALNETDFRPTTPGRILPWFHGSILGFPWCSHVSLVSSGQNPCRDDLIRVNIRVGPASGFNMLKQHLRKPLSALQKQPSCGLMVFPVPRDPMNFPTFNNHLLVFLMGFAWPRVSPGLELGPQQNDIFVAWLVENKRTQRKQKTMKRGTNSAEVVP